MSLTPVVLNGPLRFATKRQCSHRILTGPQPVFPPYQPNILRNDFRTKAAPTNLCRIVVVGPARMSHASPGLTMRSIASTRTAIFFDLDNTLFDHHHSLQCAISAIRAKYVCLSQHTNDELVTKYNAALQTAYDKYLRKEITYEEFDLDKVYLFFVSLSLPKPTPEQAREFRATYQPVYRQNRRATLGSIETVCRLREHGYLIAIVTNGQTEDQVAKAECIGVRHLVDRIVTSEEAGCSKPEPFIFKHAAQLLGINVESAFMVGDSPDADIKGAIEAGMRPVWYSPTAVDSQAFMFDHQVPIVQHMSQLLDLLDLGEI